MTEPRALILAEARDLYRERGPEAVTMRNVAERVGVTATALYRHFSSKDDLLHELVWRAFETFGSYLYWALNGRTPLERLQSSAEAYLKFAFEQREFYRTIFMGPLPKAAEDGRTAAHAGRCDPSATHRFVVDRLRECVNAGDLRACDPEQVAVTVWAHVHGLVSLHIAGVTGQTDEDFRTTYRRSLEHLFTGITQGNNP